VPGWTIASRASWPATANRIRYIPIWVEEAITFNRIGVEVETGAAGTCDLRIFKWLNGLPAALILSAGTVDTTAVGIKTIAISQFLGRGFYFLAYRCTAACSLYGPLDNIWIAPVQGYGIAGFPSHELVVLYKDDVYTDPAAAPDVISYGMTACAFLGVA
jgi:hypothetical protein